MMAIEDARIGDDKQVLPFTQALYHGVCGECGEGLEWEAYFDADGTTYGASCCGYRYRMAPHSVTVSRERRDEDDNED